MPGRLLAALTLAAGVLAAAACESGEEAPTPAPGIAVRRDDTGEATVRGA